MAILVDTSVLVRMSDLSDRQHETAWNAIAVLHLRGEELYATPQTLIEFRAVATRPVKNNGLGFSIAEVELQAAEFEARFIILDDTQGIYPAWKSIVAAAQVIGKRVHDARLVAVCHVHGVDRLLTFNIRDFVGLSSIAPGVAIIDPATV